MVEIHILRRLTPKLTHSYPGHGSCRSDEHKVRRS
jgi:hypothetical protein